MKTNFFKVIQLCARLPSTEWHKWRRTMIINKMLVNF